MSTETKWQELFRLEGLRTIIADCLGGEWVMHPTLFPRRRWFRGATFVEVMQVWKEALSDGNIDYLQSILTHVFLLPYHQEGGKLLRPLEEGEPVRSGHAMKKVLGKNRIHNLEHHLMNLLYEGRQRKERKETARWFAKEFNCVILPKMVDNLDEGVSATKYLKDQVICSRCCNFACLLRRSPLPFFRELVLDRVTSIGRPFSILPKQIVVAGLGALEFMMNTFHEKIQGESRSLMTEYLCQLCWHSQSVTELKTGLAHLRVEEKTFWKGRTTKCHASCPVVFEYLLRKSWPQIALDKWRERLAWFRQGGKGEKKEKETEKEREDKEKGKACASCPFETKRTKPSVLCDLHNAFHLFNSPAPEEIPILDRIEWFLTLDLFAAMAAERWELALHIYDKYLRGLPEYGDTLLFGLTAQLLPGKWIDWIYSDDTPLNVKGAKKTMLLYSLASRKGSLPLLKSMVEAGDLEISGLYIPLSCDQETLNFILKNAEPSLLPSLCRTALCNKNVYERDGAFISTLLLGMSGPFRVVPKLEGEDETTCTFLPILSSSVSPPLSALRQILSKAVDNLNDALLYVGFSPESRDKMEACLETLKGVPSDETFAAAQSAGNEFAVRMLREKMENKGSRHLVLRDKAPRRTRTGEKGRRTKRKGKRIQRQFR